MADAIAAIVGAAFMITFITMIATRANELPLWIVCLAGIALMLWAFWTDTFRPMFAKRDD